MRARRQSSSLPRVALAGYTNAGKSTLLNALTGAEVGVGDRLFHTLDPTTRSVAALRPRLPPHRHGRLHREAAPPAGRGVQGDPGGDGPRRPDPAGGRRGGARASGGWPTWRRSTRCWRRSAPATSRACSSSTRPTCSTRRSAARRCCAIPGRCWSRPWTARGSRSCASGSRTAFEDTLAEVELLVPYSRGGAAARAARGGRRPGADRA